MSTAKHMAAKWTKVVVIVDTDDGAYYEHHVFGSVDLCQAFADGMKAAWDISHGPSNCWRPFVLGNRNDREAWEHMGSPGADEMRAASEGAKS